MPSLDFYIDWTSADVQDTLGGRLSRAHDMAGTTVDALAAQAGVKSRQIRLWESDRSAPDAGQIAALAAALGVSPMWLAAGIGDGPEKGDDSRNRLTLKFTP